MDQPAQFRAQWAKQIVATAKRYPEPERTRLLTAIGEEARGAIRSAGLLDYVEASVFRNLLRGVYITLGEDDRNVYYSKALALALDTPLLKPLYKGGSGMFGRGPSGILRMTPFVWKLLTRDCGTVTAIKGEPRSLGLVFAVGLPFIDDEAFIAGMAGYMHGALAWTETIGEVTSTVDRDEQAIHYHAVWA